jgi:hypothetical protein
MSVLLLLLLCESLQVSSAASETESDRPTSTGTAHCPRSLGSPVSPQPASLPTSAELAEHIEQALEPEEPPTTLSPTVRKTVRLLKVRKFLKTWLPFLPIP